MLPTCMDCGGILASEQLRQALHSLGVKTDFGLACSGTEVKTENFECILKILEHIFSLPIFSLREKHMSWEFSLKIIYTYKFE